MVHILTSTTSHYVYRRKWWGEKWTRSAGLHPARENSIKRGGAKPDTYYTFGSRPFPRRYQCEADPLRLWYVVLCQHMPRCISIYISAPAATARPLSFRTPTVASGTVVFVNATPVVSYKSPEWSGPDKHRHGGFRLFFTLFPGRGEWSPDSEATFKHYHIRKWSQFREQAVLDDLPGEANLDRSPEERKVRKRKKKKTFDLHDLWNDCKSRFNNMFLIFRTFAHYSLLALVKTKPPCLCGHWYKPVFASRQPIHTSHFFLTATSLNKSWLLINMHTTVCTSTAWALFLECQTHLTRALPCE